jgi:hypothetical protein
LTAFGRKQESKDRSQETEFRREKRTTKTRRHKEKQIVVTRAQLSKFEE